MGKKVKLTPVKRLGPNDCYNCGKRQRPLKYGLCNDCHQGYLESGREERERIRDDMERESNQR